MHPKRGLNQLPAMKAFLALGTFILLMLSVFGLHRLAAASPLDQEILEGKAITVAQEVGGLQGAPTSQTVVLTTMAEWAARIDAQPGKDAAQFGLSSDAPVFILALRGHIDSRLVGSVPPDRSTADTYEAMIVVLDARTGGLLWIGNYYEASQMPIQIPN